MAAKEDTRAVAEPCNVVLTHVNADFDSLASAVALAKLWSIHRPDYPTHVVLPRGSNPLTARFLAYHKHLLPIRGFSTIAPDDLHAIGICDTQTRERIGPAANWLQHASHVAVYDHHSFLSSDIHPDELTVEPVGSVTTMMVERLQALSDHPLARLSEAEATLFALGIRADTGALSYSDTTPRDGKALVWLMEHGASQSAISEFGQVRLSEPQREILTEALSSTQQLSHHGLKIGVVSAFTGRGFITGLSSVAQEVMDLGSYDVILMGIVHENAKGQRFLSLIGRCSARAITVNLVGVMQRFSGGGHPSAAAATTKLKEEAEEGAEMDEAKALLWEAVELVKAQIPDQVRAEDIMTRTVHSLLPEDTMEYARQFMQRIEKKGAPVVGEDGKLMGTLKFRDVIKAAQSGKAQQLAKAWMRREMVTVSPGMTFDEVEDLLVAKSVGRLPVVDEEGKILGIITRTDVLRQHKFYESLRGRTG